MRFRDGDVVAGERKTRAMPWPMRPEPTTVMSCFCGRPGTPSPPRRSPSGVEDVAGVEVHVFEARRRTTGRRDQTGLAEAALRHAGHQSGTRRLPAPRRRRTLISVSGEAEAIVGLSASTVILALLDPQRGCGDAVRRRLEAQRPVEPRDDDVDRRADDIRNDLAALALLPASAGRGMCHQRIYLRNVSVDHIEKFLALWLMILATRSCRRGERQEY